MTLDYELVRTILIHVEATPPNQMANLAALEGNRDAIFEHVELLEEHGLLEAKFKKSPGSPRILAAVVFRLTWDGHEFLKNAKNDQIWNRAKDLVREKGGSVSMEVFKSLLVRMAESVFGLR